MFRTIIFSLTCLQVVPLADLSAQNLQFPHTNTYPIPLSDTFPHLNRLSRLTAARSRANPAKTNQILSECNTSTFYAHVTTPANQKITLKEIQTLPDGNFILAGNIILPNAEQEGLLTIIGNSGNILLQKQLRINNKPITVFTIKIRLNGTILVAGIVHDVTDKPFVSLLNNDLTVNWMRIFDEPSPPVKITLDLVENDQVSFAVQLSASVIYFLLNVDGTTAWMKQSSPAGLDELVGISQLVYSELGVVVNCTRSGKKIVEVLRISQQNGSLLSSHTIGISTDENKFSETTSWADRLITIGVVQKSPTEFRLVRDIMYSSANIESEHNYILGYNIDFTTTSAMDNAGDALGLCFPQQGKLVFIRHYAYYQTWPEYTRSYTVPVGASITAVTRSLTDGGYLFGMNTADSSQIVLIKTDSIGRISGCSYSDISNNYQEILNGQNTASATTGITVSIAFSSGTLTGSVAQVSSQFDCNQNFCPPLPAEDTCLSTYYKTFRSNSHVDAFNKYYLMRNDNQLAITVRYDRVLGNHNQMSYGVKLFDEKGNFIKGVTVFCDSVSSYPLSRQIDDQHIMLINYTVKNGIPCYAFTLINDSLQVVWTKAVQTFSAYNYFTGGMTMGDLVRDQEGNYYFITNNLGFNETPKFLVYKMDASGNQVWLKSYEVQNGLFFTCNAAVTNTSLIIVIEGDPAGSTSVRLDKNTGQMLNAYRYANSCAGAIYDRLVEFEEGHIFYAGNNAQSNFVMGLFDTTGRPVKLKAFDQISSIMRAATVKSGKLFAKYNYYTGSSYKNVLLKADTALAIQFINEFDIIRWGYPNGLAVSDNGSIYSGGNFSSGGTNGSYYDPYIEKFDEDGRLGTCNSTTSNPVITDINLNITTPAFNELIRSFSPITIAIDLVPDIFGQHISDLLCSSMPQCTSVHVTGPDTICQLNQNYTYNAIRNPGCQLQPVWLYDTSYAALQSTTDSTAVFKFKRTGNTWLKAKLNTGCSSYIDSILVQVQNGSLVFSLGNDTLLCPGDSIYLNAGNGFSSYHWQDGSTDSTLMVTAAGLYFVEVSNLCGDLRRDTIQISAAIIPNLNIGNDSSICKGDTLYIHASPGFSNYNWQPSGAIIGQGQQVYTIPMQNETITVTALTAEGCSAYDTLSITSIFANPVSLGNDTSFCSSDSLVLSAGTGYSQYNWSTGSSASSIIVHQQGSYWVIATSANGCTAKDTMVVQNIFALPLVNLNHDSTLCAGDTRILDAGNGFSYYLWNDGTTSRAITVNNVGLYAVIVTDYNGCRNSDTTVITTLFPLPANFLPADTAICSYSSLVIKPSQTYRQYLWNNNTAAPQITISLPGIYWLQVTDNNNCKGRDSIVVNPKDCMKGLYVPSAFTPNRDGKNDVFRPLLFGKIKAFSFSIYNRWGNLVFQTNEPGKGWDGVYAGRPQDSNVFVWLCSYQLENEPAKTAKGTFALIR